MKQRPYYRQAKIIENLKLRAKLIQAVRDFFTENGYLEVETPVRLPSLAPEVHIDPVESSEWFLQTSPEICMKRLLAAGYDRIFQICKCFRKGERGRKHVPELTMLEWYRKGADYNILMDETEALVKFVAERLGSIKTVSFDGHEVNISGDWQRITVNQAYEKYSEISASEALKNDRFDEIMGLEIEPNLGTKAPCFLHDYPSSCAALSRISKKDPSVAERFELYIAGLELCNAFSELTDHVEQRQRFEADFEERMKTGKITAPIPEKFLESLPMMPVSAGCALGIDRLVMLFAGASDIDSVVSFTPEEL
ncbi:EF-P lysine aminoacylase EpmA [Desulforegula conservatrix]|uniref:EF-P lysine aminoacylase EpmA n=1 Tax=Desulforegula conservatrix TaxID=153026 RepID=UPI000410CE8D|nr:EF-P lysine aminoacylase EpmA [Desulforegula conservatrix]